ncbi:MAG: GMC family oxidoreductase N-terminal domain-containing protein [Acidimicrobiia bacterium]|nr:GMC family oxidoreductase N-terminal domain-containing protein [Acidimicrobiia bacterium]
MANGPDDATYDHVIVGGGTAGSVLAARLAEDTGRQVALVEAGPADEGLERVLRVRDWMDLLGGDLDWDYTIEPQPRGNSTIRHSRARVLGGCSSHNSCIAFVAPDADLRRWEAAGARGWGPDECAPHYQRVLDQVHVAEPHGPVNPLNEALIEAAASTGLGRLHFGERRWTPGAGLLELNVLHGIRQSASVAYLHPLDRLPDNLSLRCDTRVWELLFDGERATGIRTSTGTLWARHGIVLAAGAFESPRLLQLAGIGPAEYLRSVGIEPRVDLPGVGANLQDHPEGIVMWSSTRAIPEPIHQYWEVGIFADIEGSGEPDLMFHGGLTAFDLNTAPLGYPSARHAFCLTPNVCRARSRGTVRVRTAHPGDVPAIDFAYFTDPESYDEAIMVAGVELARDIARQPALEPWVGSELAPGADVTSREAVSAYARSTANTVYHPCGTCAMGDTDDPMAVVDPELRVRGVDGLRVVDASVFPEITSVNPAITVMMVGERAAEFIRAEEPA